MRRPVKLLMVGGVIAAILGAAYQPAAKYWKDRNRVSWNTAKVSEGDLVRYVNSTGSVRPVLSVSVGSFVSGPIVELNVDFNDEVKEGDVLAKVDPRLFKASVDRDQATLATRVAEVERIEAQLRQAMNNYQRGLRLREKNKDFLSDREMDALVFEVKSLQSQRKLAKASVLQAQASLETSLANLNYTEITSPVDGVVIDRKIDPGQTLAAQFQTPELFVVAPDLRKKVHVFASVDEADIGLIQQAQSDERPVTFTVDAHPDELFEGKIEQIRLSSVSTQNVVTYPVVIAAANADLRLLPGMTASISFEVDSKRDVTKVPNAALRFYPTEIKWVREDDRGLLDGSKWKSEDDDDDKKELSATEKATARKKRNQRHVWVVDGELLRAVEITTGISENRFTELVKGDLEVGDELVTELKR
ncbi:MAG: efflux RND transporter periplasmic adaptor subunit [Planctomycetota bacterium]